MPPYTLTTNQANGRGRGGSACAVWAAVRVRRTGGMEIQCLRLQADSAGYCVRRLQSEQTHLRLQNKNPALQNRRTQYPALSECRSEHCISIPPARRARTAAHTAQARTAASPSLRRPPYFYLIFEKLSSIVIADACTPKTA